MHKGGKVHSFLIKDLQILKNTSNQNTTSLQLEKNHPNETGDIQYFGLFGYIFGEIGSDPRAAKFSHKRGTNEGEREAFCDRRQCQKKSWLRFQNQAKIAQHNQRRLQHARSIPSHKGEKSGKAETCLTSISNRVGTKVVVVPDLLCVLSFQRLDEKEFLRILLLPFV